VTVTAESGAGPDGAPRITYLSTTGALGGAELDLVDIVAALRSSRPGWPLAAVLGDEGPLREALEALGVPCTVLPIPGRLARLGDASLKGPGGLLRLASRAPGASVSAGGYLGRLRRALAATRPDWVQTNDMKAHALGAWAAPGGVPVAWYLQDYASSRAVMSRLLRLSGSARPRVVPVAISRSVADDLERVLGRAGGSLRWIHPAIDLGRFAPGPGRPGDLDASAGLPPAPAGTVRVGLVATFARWKGHEVFLEAAGRVDPSLPCRFYVVGGPIYRSAGSQHSMEDLRALADRPGLAGRVGFTGHWPDPASAMRALDVVVHASTRPEPFGRVIAEGMACGRAVVAVGLDGPRGRAGGSAELFEDGSEALAVPPGDPEALAAAIARLVADPGLRAALGAAGRRAALARFDRARLADDWAPLYLERSRTARPAEAG
jgi:glycosyltransferase involved in cell wall biosynthesis